MPHNINRKPTSLEQFSKWKSSELKIFLFYESIPLLIGKVSPAFFTYYSSYVIAVRMLYEPIEDEDTINKAERILKAYLKELENVYSKFAQTFTAHAHLHLAEQVRLFGPLHCHSQFFFEVKFKIFLKKLINYFNYSLYRGLFLTLKNQCMVQRDI